MYERLYLFAQFNIFKKCILNGIIHCFSLIVHCSLVQLEDNPWLEVVRDHVLQVQYDWTSSDESFQEIDQGQGHAIVAQNDEEAGADRLVVADWAHSAIDGPEVEVTLAVTVAHQVLDEAIVVHDDRHVGHGAGVEALSITSNRDIHRIQNDREVVLLPGGAPSPMQMMKISSNLECLSAICHMTKWQKKKLRKCLPNMEKY